MANASNNGLLPLNNGQTNGQGGYSQVSPMMGMYYNAAEAPTGSSVLGYNYGAGGLMPGGVTQGGTSATPTPPTGGSLSVGTGNSGGNNASAANTGYSSAGSNAAAVSAYAAGTGNSSNQYGTAAVNGQSNPVAGPSMQSNAMTAQPKYNPSGPLASPNAHAIPAQIQANTSGQMQGSSQNTNNADAWSRMQPQATIPRPVSPGPLPIQGGNPPHPPISTQPIPPQPPVYKPPVPVPPKPPVGPIKKPVPPGVHPGKPPAKPPAKGKPAPAPPESALDKWLAGDTTYQQQLAEYNQEQQAYNQNYTNTGDQIGQNFNATQRSMNNQAALDRMNQQYDFAGRGVLSSGAYAQALDQYNTQFQNNVANLVTGENQQLQTNQTNYNNFLRQLVLQRNAAKQDAIARRAAQLGITS